MSLANALNAEIGCMCLHEGKIRKLEESGEQILPFLTLQNRRAYEYPQEALGLLKAARAAMIEIALARGLTHFGDIAYNYAPFSASIDALFPDAKIVYQCRDCLGFLISSTATTTEDSTPVGWPPTGKTLSKIERFIALGRLQPRAGSWAAEQWRGWSHIAKNIWLWSETNRLILDAIDTLGDERVYRMKFERFQFDPLAEYKAVRQFLNLPGTISPVAAYRLTNRPINYRKDANRQMTRTQLGPTEQAIWLEYAEPVRQRLGYT